MRLVVGLGNPGREYGTSRHNIGFRVVDKLAADAGARWQTKSKFEADIAEAQLGGRAVLLAKPLTFMNASGSACAALLHWHKFEPEQMLVIVDDADLDVGRLRLREKGSAGGHRGLLSIAQCAGSEQYPRLRIGIGRPEPGRAADGLVGFVLGRFRDDERPQVDEAVARAAQAVESAVARGVAAAMNEFNG
ncbi:MAG: aminoacyl-tRNA hydrolase [Verrucomicrobia bacterium]|nr:aminoacyl-tRNA hydrolase [Verrucomicrobiota bacterium]